MAESATEMKERTDRIEKMRTDLLANIKSVADAPTPPTGEEIAFHTKMEEGLGKFCDDVAELLKSSESDEVKALREQIEEIERKAVGEPQSVAREGEPEGFRNKSGKIASYYEKNDGRNLFMDMREGARGADRKAGELVMEHQAAIQSEARLKAWATGDLEDVDLIMPDVQAALPFLAAQAKLVGLCRELRTTSTSVEFPVFLTGLDVEHVAEGQPKPESDPTFELRTAGVFTIAGLTEVPNGLLEDYATARGWIASELGRACGVQEDLDVIQGDGTGEPLGFLNHGDITARAAAEVDSGEGINGRAIIEAIFRALQDVRVDGLTEPTDIGLRPSVWTDIVLSYATNVGYLYGPPGADDAAPKGEPQGRLLGLPVTQDAHIPNTYGGTSNQSPVIVGNFNDAVVLRRSPFRIDVDTSLGFKTNTTWFRGEERMGFIVTRPSSFKVVTNIIPTA